MIKKLQRRRKRQRHMPAAVPESDWMTEEEVAREYRRSKPALQQDRSLGRGWTYYRFSPRTIRYRRSEIDAAVAAARVVPSNMLEAEDTETSVEANTPQSAA